MNADWRLADSQTGAHVHTAPVVFVDGKSGAINGIAGAVLSMVVKREAAERTLARGIAAKSMKLVYPELKLGTAGKQRLKGPLLFQPRVSAISSLAPSITSDAEPALDGTIPADDELVVTAESEQLGTVVE